jgi:enoyl-CoA hydratase
MSGVRVDVDVTGAAATVWLDRPERMNALDAAMWNGLEKAFAHLAGARDVRVVVVRSACERAFCTGLDLSSGAIDEGGLRATVRRYQRIFDAVEDHPTPVVAVLHGHVLGGGLELAMACDLRVCAADAVLGLTEARVGLIPADGGTQRLAKYVGVGRAKRMLLTGMRIDAARALDWGLVEEVVSRADLAATVDTLVAELVRAAPLAQRAIKHLVRTSFEAPRERGGSAEAEAACELAGSRDLAEGFTAFMEKRQPVWRGE